MPLPLVSALARRYGSEIYLANIAASVPYSMGGAAPAAQETEELNDALAKAKRFAKSPELANLQIKIIVEEGDVTDEISRIVQEQNIDLVVLNTHGRTGWKHLLMGSVAESLLRELGCPVLTVGPRLSKTYSQGLTINTILFPTDLSNEACTAFPYFAGLAADHRSELIIVHILPEEAGVNPDARRLAEPLRQEIRSAYSPFLLPESSADFVIGFGDPAARILELAETRNAALIGMGIRRVPELVTHFRNTVTYRVVLQSSCPVLTIRASDHDHRTGQYPESRHGGRMP